MTNLWLMLILKSTAVLLSGALLAFCLRRCSAAARHLVWVSTMALLLLLPLGLVLPREAAVARLQVASTSSPAAKVTAIANPPVLTWIWAGVAVCLLLRLAISAYRASRLVREARPTGQVRGIHIRTSADAPGPLAWTFGRGAVVIPASASGWNVSALDAALSHEAAHLKRRDGYALMIGELARALYWFHPLVWYALHRLRIEQEHAADDAVLATGVEAAEYAQHLVELARFGRTQPLLAGAVTMRTLASRVATILDDQRSRTVQNRRMVLSSIAAVLIASIPLTALQSSDKVYRIGEDGVSAPVLIQKQEPNYTPEAKDAKIEGSVLLSAIVEPTGRLSDIQVKRSLDPGLDQNAIAALTTWLFKPAEKDGTPVRVSCNIEVNFRLL